VPLAEAVVFAMLASYFLSRTLVPTLSKYWLRRHVPDAADRARGFLARIQASFDRGFRRWRDNYYALLEKALAAGPRFAGAFLLAMASVAILAFPSAAIFPGLGQDSSRRLTAGRSGCICERAPAYASMKPRRFAIKSRARFAS